MQKATEKHSSNFSRSRASLVGSKQMLTGRGPDVAILQDQRKMAILEKTLKSGTLSQDEAWDVNNLGRKLGGCGKNGIEFTPPHLKPKNHKEEARDKYGTEDGRRILIDRVNGRVKLDAKMCKSFACSRCALRAAGKAYARLVPIETLMTKSKRNFKIAFITLQGTQNASMPIEERIATADAEFAMWRRSVDAARNQAIRENLRPLYGAIALFEAQVIDPHTEAWIKPHYHVLFVCDDDIMFSSVLMRLRKHLSPSECKIVENSVSDKKRIISYLCKENYGGCERGQDRGYSESIHESRNARVLVELATLVAIRRGRPNMRISGVLRDAKALLYAEDITIPQRRKPEWINIHPARNGHLDVLAVCLGHHGNMQDLVAEIPEDDQAAQIICQSKKSAALKLVSLRRKKAAAEIRYERSGHKDSMASLWIATINDELKNIDQPIADVLDREQDKQSTTGITHLKQWRNSSPQKIRRKRHAKSRVSDWGFFSLDISRIREIRGNAEPTNAESGITSLDSIHDLDEI